MSLRRYLINLIAVSRCPNNVIGGKTLEAARSFTYFIHVDDDEERRAAQ